MDEQELQGYWWRPGQEDRRRPGTLKVARDGALTLRLVGGFDLMEYTDLGDGVTQGVLSDTTDFPIVHGDSAGQPITLVEGMPTNTTGGLAGHDIESQTITASRAYLGLHLRTKDQPIFTEATIRLEYLLGWSLDLKLATASLPHVGDQDATDDATGDVVAPRTAECNGFTVTLRHYQLRSFTRRERLSTNSSTNTDYADLVITSENPRPIDDFDEVIKALMDLITLAAHAPAGVIQPMVLSADDDGAIGEDIAGAGRVELIGKHTHDVDDVDKEDDRSVVHYLFTLADTDFAGLIPQWLRLHHLLWLPLSMLTGLLYLPHGYNEQRLLTAAAAAEGIHRELHPTKSPYSETDFEQLRTAVMAAMPTGSKQARANRDFVHRSLHNSMTYLERLHDLAAIPDQEAVRTLISDVDKWATFVKDFRNGVAHADRDAADGDERHHTIYATREVTVGLLSLVVLQQLDLSSQVQQHAARHPKLLFAAQTMRRALNTRPAE